jgi:chromosome segregation ATPase
MAPLLAATPSKGNGTDSAAKQSSTAKKALAGEAPWATEDVTAASPAPKKPESTSGTPNSATPSSGRRTAVSPKSPAVHTVWLNAMNMWSAAGAAEDAEKSLSLCDDDDEENTSAAAAAATGDSQSDLLSPRAMVDTPIEELEHHCTPSKLKRYIALHLEKLIEHEEARSALSDELAESQASVLAFKEAFEAKNEECAHYQKAATEANEGLVILEDGNTSLSALCEATNRELVAARQEISDQERSANLLRKELQDLHEAQWEGHRDQEAARELEQLKLQAEVDAVKAQEALAMCMEQHASEMAALQAELSAAKAAADNSDALAASAAENEVLQKELGELNQQLIKANEEAHAEIMAKSEQTAKLEATVQEAESRVTEANAKLEALTVERAEIEAKAEANEEAMTTELATADANAEEAAIELNELRAELANAEAKAQEAATQATTADLEALRYELVTCKAQAASMEAEKMEEVETLRAELAAVMLKMEAATSESEAEAKQAQENGVARDVATQKLEAALEEVASLKVDLDFVTKQAEEICTAANTEAEEKKALEVKLTEALDARAAQEAAAQENVEKLEGELATMQRQSAQTNEEAKQEVVQLQATLTEAQHKGEASDAALNTELEKAQAEIDALTEELATAELKAEEASQSAIEEAARAEEAATEQNAKHADALAANDTLRAELDEISAQSVEANAAASARFEALQKELSDARASANEAEVAAAAEIEVLQTEVANAEVTAEEAAAKAAMDLEALQNELQEVQTAAADAAATAAAEIEALQSKLANAEVGAEESASKLMTENEELQNELEQTKSAAADAAATAATEIETLQSEVANAEVTAEEAAAKAAMELEALRADLASIQEGAKEAAAAAAEQIATLQQQLDEVSAGTESALAASATEVEALFAQLQAAQEAAQSAEMRATAAEEEHATQAESFQQQLAAQAAETEATLAVAVSHATTAEDKIVALETDAASLKATIETLEEQSSERATSLAAYAEQVAQLTSAGEDRAQDFERTIEGLHAGMASAGAEAAREIAERDQHLAAVRSELAEVCTSRDEALARVASAESRASEAEAAVTNAAAEVKAIDQAKGAAEQELFNAASTIERLTSAHAAAVANEQVALRNSEKWKEEVDALQALRKKMHNEIIDLKGNIRVFCRIRPSKRQLQGLAPTPTDGGALEVNAHPTNSSAEVIDVFDGAPVGTDSGLKRYGGGKRHQFGFDKVFDGSSTQDQVYSEVAPLVQSALDGYSLCIFAYGQTGSGKTHSMIGDTEVVAPGDALAAAPTSGLDRGIVYRACEQIFAELNNKCAAGSAVYESTVTIEAVEIYNEKLRDLLPTVQPKKGAPPTNLEIRKDPKSGGAVYIEGIEAHAVTQVNDAVGYLNQALRQRATKATKCNDQSSRSHCVLIVRFAKTNVETGVTKSGALHFCDLAGSERLAKSGSSDDPALLREAQAINKSLSALGNTMSALVSGGRHVPFRDSKLTFLLQDCFTGDGKSLLLCALSPETDSVQESVGSLRFAQTVSQVTAKGNERCTSCGDKLCSKRKGEQ